jgi:hypothetical protein
MRVVSNACSALGFVGFLVAVNAASIGRGRVRGQVVDESEPKLYNRRLHVTGVGGNGGGSGSGYGGIPVSPIASPGKGSTGGAPIASPNGKTKGSGKKAGPGIKGASKGKGGGRSINGNQGGFRSGTAVNTTSSICTCISCTVDVLNTMAGNFTCGERIDYLLNSNSAAYPTTATACHQVGGLEFPNGKNEQHLTWHIQSGFALDVTNKGSLSFT